MKTFVNSLVITIVVFLFTPQTITAQCHIDDWNALKALYENTDGDNWSNNSGWEEVTGDAPTASCNLEIFVGVTLDENGRVRDLKLRNKIRSGSIPPEIGNLTNLRKLDLSNSRLSTNGLSGVIPKEIGNLGNLFDLYLQNNQINGAIPPELGNLTNLFTLEIYNNNLSGCYSANLSKLCNQLYNPYHYYYDYYIGDYSYYTESTISSDNNFDASWGAFCFNDGAGLCQSCTSNIPNLIIDSTTSPQNLFWVSGSITTSGSVEINDGEQVEYKASNIILNKGFKANVGCNFTASYNICD